MAIACTSEYEASTVEEEAFEYFERFVDHQAGNPALAIRLVEDARRGRSLLIQQLAQKASPADIVDDLRAAGYNALLVGPGYQHFELPGETASFLVMDTENGCDEIFFERWEALSDAPTTNIGLIGVGREDLDGKSRAEKQLHLASFELPGKGEYVEIQTGSFSPLGKGIIAFAIVGGLTGCDSSSDEEQEPTVEPPPPPPPPPPPAPEVGVVAGRNELTKYEYKLGETRAKRKMGPAAPVIFEGRTLVTWAFEVCFPAGPEDCPHVIRQTIRDTVKTANGQEIRLPPPAPPDPGGFESSGWSPDPPPNGINPNIQVNPDGTRSYLDTPGLAISNTAELPASKDTMFRWELFDCDGQRLDCKESVYTLRIAADGTVQMRFTAPVTCS